MEVLPNVTYVNSLILNALTHVEKVRRCSATNPRKNSPNPVPPEWLDQQCAELFFEKLQNSLFIKGMQMTAVMEPYLARRTGDHTCFEILPVGNG